MTTTTTQPNPAQTEAVDPVTFEVIRHRLWAINDDQATMAARLSGSPIIFEGYDFNAALTTADGQALCTGVYILHHGTTMDEFIRHVLELWDPSDIREGDMFFTNDPWMGALHANDGILVMPLFWAGELVGWSGIVTHDSDVGSPTPGSFVVGASDRFGEAPLIPAVKMVSGFELRPEMERIYLRNTRTPESNALNMRARVAALRMTHGRISALIEQYGKDAFLAVQRGILDYVERVLRARLREIPDGIWFSSAYLDHDGVSPAVYPICCRVIKRDDRLIFDLTGSAPQAPGSINCARPAMMGALLGVALTSLCYDLPWAVGAVRKVVEVISEPGTINNATGAAGVSMASVMATLTTMDVASAAIAKMLLASEHFVDEAQANWSPGMHGGLFIAENPGGPPTVLGVTDPFGGGGGARTFGDGIDSGGIPHSMASRIANVEVLESRGPILTLFRRELPDSGGPGRYRGGVALISAVKAHKAPAAILYQTTASGMAAPSGRGLSGGSPGSAASSTILRGTDVEAQFAAGLMPTTSAQLSAASTELQQAKQLTVLAPDDVAVGILPGGSGYGDPLRRDAAAVARDVCDGLVSAELAERAYGVVMGDDTFDAAATDALRDRLRGQRRSEGTLVGNGGGQDSPHGAVEGKRLHAVSDSVEAITDRSGAVLLRCTGCAQFLGHYADDLKQATLRQNRPLSHTVAHTAACLPEYELREYSCPGCGTALAVDVQHRDEPVLDESSFGTPGAAR